MTNRTHSYSLNMKWTGNTGEGTKTYEAYGRDHLVSTDLKQPILGSADPSFRGDPKRWNPEELLVASLSACHKLWYLHLCAVSNIVLHSYEDNPEGRMCEEDSGCGQFVLVTLRPQIEILKGDVELAHALHRDAHGHCFIARSVNFDVLCDPRISKLV